METKKDIYSFWVHYTTKNEEIYFRKFITGLVSIWENQINLDWTSDESIPDPTTVKCDFGPPLSRLPEELLPAIGKFLYVTKDKMDEEDMTSDELKEAELLVRTLILISRNFNNIPSVAATDYVHLIISISSNIMLKILHKQMEKTIVESISFCVHCAHLLECLYDPYFTWRYFKRTNTFAQGIPKTSKASPIALLHIGVIPFIFENFEQKIGEMVPPLAFELLNVLGAVVSGSQDKIDSSITDILKNSLTGVCPATVSLLVTVISSDAVDVIVRVAAVKCFIMMVHNLLSIPPHQRQIEICTLLEQYRGCLVNIIPNTDEASVDEYKLLIVSNMIDMLSVLINVLDQKHAEVMRCIMVQNRILESILDALEKIEVCTDLLHSCFTAIAVIIKREVFAKERMMKINGYVRIFRKLKLIEYPDSRLLMIFVEMAIEEKYEKGKFYTLQNSSLVVPLLQFLPLLESTNQEWLASTILSICCCNLQCKWKAIKCGTILTVCEILTKYNFLTSATIDQLISLIETLASVSISTSELKRIFNLFLVGDNKLCPYYLRILQTLSNITRSNNFIDCRSYFDIQSNADGISIPEIKKWPGSVFGFTFHCWISLNKLDSENSDFKVQRSSTYRRHIFSLFTSTKQGIQVNINAESKLIIIINTKKEFLAISLFDFTFEKNRWYCLDILYIPSKRPFAQNQIIIFIDGVQQLVSTAKFAHISENFIWCRIGAPIEDVSLETEVPNTTNQILQEPERSSILPSFISHVPNYITLPLRTSSSVNPYIKNFPLGTQATVFGPTVALGGQMGNISLFQEPLTAAQIRLLCEIGINGDIISNVEDNFELSNLQSRLVFSYSPLACAFHCAVDLCSKYKIDGRTIASVCCVHCLKENINSIGGVNVFLPFFETLDYSTNTKHVALSRSRSEENHSGVAEMVMSNFRNVAEVKLEENPVAVIITLIKNLLKDSLNQEYFLKHHGFAMLGKQLAQVSPHLMDIYVLMSVCMLAEDVISTKNPHYQITFYQNILFNFDVWFSCNFEVQLEHVQFLYSYVRKDKKFFKKRFGVQFFLDVMRKNLSNEDLTNAEATKSVRVAIIGVINYFIQKEVNIQEINAIINYAISCNQEIQIVEIVEVLISHLQSKSCTDQLYLLLFEEHTADLFYTLLVNPTFGADIKRTIFRLYSVLLRTNRVYERSKYKLQLQDHTEMGLYPGLIMSFPTDQIFPLEMALMILDQMFITVIETNGCYAGALILLNRLSDASIDIKIEVARKILTVVFMRPNAPLFFAKQIGWQDSVARLLVRHPINDSNAKSVPITVQSIKMYEEKSNNSSKRYPSRLKDVTSRLESDFKDVTGTVGSLVSDNIQLAASNISSAAENVSSLVAENIHYAASNITSAAENVHILVSENIQYATDSISSVAENVTSAVTDNISFATENISSVVSSAYSLITQKSIFDRTCTLPAEAESDSFSLSSGNHDSFTLINFDDLSLSNRYFSSGSINEIDCNNRSQNSYGKYSPSHVSKDSISVVSVQSGSNDSDVFDEKEEECVVFDILDPWKVNETENEENKEKVLCSAVTNILFSIMWKGYDGHQKAVWKERGQLLACINMLELNNALFCSHFELKFKLLEMMIQATIADLLANTHSVDIHHVCIENAAQLLRWVYDLIVLDPNRNTSNRISVKLLDSIVGLIDALVIIRENTSEEWEKMVKISFSILLKNVSSSNIELCAIAAAKLHTIIQTRAMLDLNECCYVLYLLSDIIVTDLNEENMEHYSFIVPVMKTLLVKLSETLLFEEPILTEMNIVNAGFGFYESFQGICKNDRWTAFLDHTVKPNFEKYRNSLSSELDEAMNIFWAECYEAYKVNLQKRNKLVTESTQRFQDIIYNPFLQRREEEQSRYSNVLSQYRNHRILLKKKWKIQKNHLIGSRCAWKNSTIFHSVHWRLSHHENFSRMRLKLIPNLNFDCHKNASSLRDNTGWAKMRLSEELILPLNISQAALRKESDFSNDQISEGELIIDKLEGNDLEIKSEPTYSTEKLLITQDCQLVTLMNVIKGRIEVTTRDFYFYDLSPIKEDVDRNDFKWSLNKLREIYLRRYNLCKTALEFFLTDQTNYFLNFNKEIRNTVFTTIMRLRPPNLLYHNYKSPSDLLKSSDLMQKWINREISNFDYLMQLNTIAGRTYNDLSQYPVFPWILADYESGDLDLNDPASFRDLSKPIGVVNPDNELEVRNKYNTFEDPCGVIAKFHYGTHYSNSAGVLHYLVRVEPFTTLHIELQSGRFDVADRQFHSIPQTWKLLMENPNDVKELIPEFFYFPEFLKNINKFDLGVLQGTKEKVDDVILPKWASSPEDFIYKHRKALESEYVSCHLHEWIDLIFGYKQRGPEAIKALNVFYYCSYEGAVDLDAIEDPTEREAVEGMINNFGQTPSQLLKEPHPPRVSLEKGLTRMLEWNIKKPDLTLFFDKLTHFQIEMASDRDPVVFVNSPKSVSKGFLSSSVPDVLLTISRSGYIGLHSWSPYDRHSTKGFSITVDESVNNARWRRDLSSSFHPTIKLHSKLFVVSHDYKLVFSAGHWDSSIKIYSLSKNRYIQSLFRHKDIVTCLAADSCGWYLISGSKDCTSIVWDVNQLNVQSPKPFQLLHGHDQPITCVSIATELDMAVSGSQDGTVNVYTIQDGYLVHTLIPEGCVSPIVDVTFVTISVQGHIAFSITDKINYSIHVYSVNGVNLGSKYVLGQVTGLTTLSDCVVVTDDAGDLTISRLLGLYPMYNIPLHIPIQTVIATSGNTHLLVPLRDGHLLVVGLPNY